MNRAKKIWCLIATIVSSLILTASFPPFEQSEGAWIAFVPLILVAMYSTPRQAFLFGYISGLLFWIVNLSWLLAIGKSGAHWSLAGLGWILISAYCAIYTAAFVSLASFLKPKAGQSSISSSINGLKYVLLLPIVWTGLEYIRALLLTGFPWNALGVSQFMNTAVIQVAEYGGVFSVSAIIILMNTALASTAERFVSTYLGKKKTARFRLDIMAALIVCAIFWTQGVRRVMRLDGESDSTAELRITAIQPNIPQLKKWPDRYEMQVYSSLQQKTDMALLGKPDLIVWPETALPAPVNIDNYAVNFTRAIARKGVPLLVGSMEASTQSAGVHPYEMIAIEDIEDQVAFYNSLYFYNSSMLFESDGDVRNVYRKNHLVPFGEYLPFDKKIKFIKRMAPLGWTVSPGREGVVFRLDKFLNIPFGALICFEDIFPSLARGLVKNGARILVNQTNDAWFDGSAGARQHMSHCVFRCVENRVPAVRSANTGITCFIDSAGRLDATTRAILKKGEERTVNYRTETIRARDVNMGLTFYTRYGDMFFAVPCMMLTVCLAVFALFLSWRNGVRNQNVK